MATHHGRFDASVELPGPCIITPFTHVPASFTDRDICKRGPISLPTTVQSGYFTTSFAGFFLCLVSFIPVNPQMYVRPHYYPSIEVVIATEENAHPSGNWDENPLPAYWSILDSERLVSEEVAVDRAGSEPRP